MKKQILKVLLAVCCLGATTSLVTSQSTTPTHVKDLDEQNKKIVEECEKPGREKPSTELNAKMPILCGKAISLPKPAFPEEAKAAKASGVVVVDIVIDEAGRVIWAKAIEGHKLLQPVSVSAACRARYSPMKVSGRPVKANVVISYSFVNK
jgi:TonB family protein